MLLQDRLPAYISWDQYMKNQERLKQNRSLLENRGVPKRGEALLQGLIVCGKCGLRMASRYKADKRPSYYCGEHARSPMNEYCGHIAAATLDEVVANVFMTTGVRPSNEQARRWPGPSGNIRR